MRKALSIAAKVLALLISAWTIYCLDNMERALLRFGGDRVDVSACARYAFLILLPLFSFCLGAAFQEVYAAIPAYIFVSAIPYVIFKATDQLYVTVFPLLDREASPVLYDMSITIVRMIAIPGMVAVFIVFPYLISNFFIKQGHKVYLLLWGQVEGNPTEPDTEQKSEE